MVAEGGSDVEELGPRVIGFTQLERMLEPQTTAALEAIAPVLELLVAGLTR